MRQSLRRQEGFTLVELLVVILIIGILAAVAIPSFLGQRSKANDTEAQQVALTMRKAMESFRTDSEDYEATVAQLVAIDDSLVDAQSQGRLAVNGSGQDYQLGAQAKVTGTWFYFERENGQITRSCDNPGVGACKSGGTWGTG